MLGNKNTTLDNSKVDSYVVCIVIECRWDYFPQNYFIGFFILRQVILHKKTVSFLTI